MGILTNHAKEVLIGFLVAVVGTLAGIYLYIELFSKFDFITTLKKIEDGNLYGQIITIGALANIFVFLVFLKKKQDARARGVLLATIVTAFITLITKFI